MRGCPWTFWWRIGKSARSFSQSIVSFGGAGMTVSVIIALRTLENDECRMTKPEGSPKTECQIRALDSRFPGPFFDIRNSDFFRHLSFGFRHFTCVIPALSWGIPDKGRLPVGLHFHFHIVPFHHHSVTFHALEGRRREHIAGLEVKRRVVPRANNLLAVNLPFGQRSACVRTGVVDGEKRPADVEHRDAIAIYLRHRGFARRQTLRVRDFN